MNTSYAPHLFQPSEPPAGVLKGAAAMFYVVDPADTTFQDADDVPNFFRQAWPYFVAFMLLENLLLWLEGRPTARLNDSLTSISHGLFQECGRLVFRGAEHWAYVSIYERWRLVDLPWDSPATWYLALVGVDFCYYWVHRACHEVHILWAQHQVHHSSEEYNLAVGLRQSLLQGWCGFVFYLPLALAIPPSHFLVHQQFNLLYQFWIHTQAVTTLGPLEWVLNTPKHHRVHHGCNLYCLDKNYGGFLIVWDRLFGTFAEERKGEEIVYGLVFNQPSFNPLYLQVFYNQHVVDKWRAMDSWWDKLAAVWKGPSWQPGKPRLGLDEDKLDIRSREKYDVRLPLWCNAYLLLHFCVVVYGFQELAARHMGMSPAVVLLFVAYVLASLTAIGLLFDNSPHASLLELVRCLAFLAYVQGSGLHVTGGPRVSVLQSFFLLSSCFWLLKGLRVLHIESKAQ
ncbi:alkylglycerol monooxygenase-like [Schistocerca serialis cubense]|uniref:alkylglycerol monooxygenase-like n=1 Tax=Schistocerca serialis cubense TaxID=2023355 RepID=UPI00214E35C4|nr:alkylglycerol monooxygenase-like [Schistocerca serialis cubense]